ncbi:MAG: flagellar hook-basal body complex protein FliE [Firmicutes bacterium]|nr:flagellar hook-basal body complex protein FliE [Bacillota bacterium]
MNTDFIVPIQPIKFGNESITKETSAAGENNMFRNIFEDAIQDVKNSQADLENKQYLLTTGQIDDAHTVPIAAAQAQLSIDLLVQLRNKAMDAYNELMRISL